MTGRKQPPISQDHPALRGFDAFDLRLGDVMRGERATIGKSLIDVQRELKIKATYIAAIENADPSAFDTPGFIAGYVRSYARYLELDPEWAWQSFCREAGFEQPHGLSASASAPKPQRSKGLDSLGDPNAAFVPRTESFLEQIELRALGSLSVLLLLVGAVGYGAWAVLQEVQRVDLAPVDQTPGVVAELSELSQAPDQIRPGMAFESAGVTSPSVDALDRLYRPRALDVPVLEPRDGPISAVEPGSVGALAESAVDRPVMRAAPEPVSAPEPVVPQVLADAAPQLNILAVRPAWVRISSADGTVLHEKILEPGERWVVPATEQPPVLRAGNSGAIYFEINGQTYGPAAPGSQVVRDVALSSQALTESYALADIEADQALADIYVAEASQ